MYQTHDQDQQDTIWTLTWSTRASLQLPFKHRMHELSHWWVIITLLSLNQPWRLASPNIQTRPFLSIVLQDNMDGLQVRHQKQWIDVPSAGSSSNKYRGLNGRRYVIVYAAIVLFEFLRGRQPACLGQARKVEFKHYLSMKQNIDHTILSLERLYMT